MITNEGGRVLIVTDWNGDTATFTVDSNGSAEVRLKHETGEGNDFVDISREDALRLADWLKDQAGE